VSVLNCVICHHPQAIERMACTSCEITMSRQLTDIVEFYCLAEGELVPGSGGDRGTSCTLCTWPSARPDPSSGPTP
jgi:hypothetical protein